LLHLVKETRKESDCVSYQLFQNGADPSDFTVVEEGAKNDLAIDSHMVCAHVQNAFGKALPLVATTPEIKRYCVSDRCELLRMAKQCLS
jgi:quinol monooxygenase YgiN